MKKESQEQTEQKFYIIVDDTGELNILEVSQDDWSSLSMIEVMLCDGLISTKTKMQIVQESLQIIRKKSCSSDAVLYYKIDT